MRDQSKSVTFCALTVAAITGPAITWAAEPASDSGGSRRRGLEEVVVTATKRETNLQETAAAISVMSSDSIEKRHLVGMDDYLAALPSVSYQDRGAGSNTITIPPWALSSMRILRSAVISAKSR